MRHIAKFNTELISATSRSIRDGHHARDHLGVRETPDEPPAQPQLQKRKSDCSQSIPASALPSSATVFVAEETILLALPTLSSMSHPHSSH
jgi:hypothetical protein